MTGHAVGWTLDDEDRARLLKQFPPTYADVVGTHVTLRMHSDDPTLPGPAIEPAVVGHADDGAGLEALVVRIGGSAARPDGGTYHITWSLDRERGREPVQSNTLLSERGWRELPKAIPVSLTPALLK